MRSRVVMLLGRTAWIRGADGWRSQSFDDAGELTPTAIAHFGKFFMANRSAKTVVVFEPKTMAHQAVETPRASRTVFASLERIRGEHPIVLSDHLGWGIETPEPIPNGAHSTLMHTELAPGLGFLREACARGGSRLVAAWSAYSTAAACLKLSLPRSEAKIVVILVEGFVGVAICNGARRSFKAWSAPMADKDWRAFAQLIGEGEGNSSLSRTELALRRGGILAVTEGDPKLACPGWPEIHRSGRVEAIVGLDALAAGAESLAAGHSANLAAGFPAPLQLDRYLVWGAAVFAGIAVASGCSILELRRQINARHMEHNRRTAALEDRLAGNKKNQMEMNALRREVPDEADAEAPVMGDALLGLAGAVPDAVTLTALSIGKDHTFEMEAMVVGIGVDIDGFQSALSQLGYKADLPNGLVYDLASGRIRIRGQFKPGHA